ncbi:MAG TPA: hypothetical protein VFL99_15535 [Segeticoccus sp.]|uniref:hypothetical protein n=1 Tax=Segeticoccus sp. TaxID=2706531 RepID=UPI002D7FFA58|nr:hypothetical protein [Segeticoccus sp.]HET8601739.1 hypothetical protein [Segeticoccus sp.]
MGTRATKRAATTAAAALTLGLTLLGVAACGQETSGGSGGSGGSAPVTTPMPTGGHKNPLHTQHGPTRATASPPHLPSSLPVRPSDPQMPTDKVRPTTYPGPNGPSGSTPPGHPMTHGPAPSK